jgi:hypothetical protein
MIDCNGASAKPNALTLIQYDALIEIHQSFCIIELTEIKNYQGFVFYSR